MGIVRWMAKKYESKVEVWGTRTDEYGSVNVSILYKSTTVGTTQAQVASLGKRGYMKYPTTKAGARLTSSKC